MTLTFDRWLSKSIGLQMLVRTKYVPSLVKIHWRILILACSKGCYGWTDGRQDGRKDGSVTISLRNFVGEGIAKWTSTSCLHSLNTNKITTYDIGNPGYDLGQAQHCGEVNPVNGIPLDTCVHVYFIVISPTNSLSFVVFM